MDFTECYGDTVSTVAAAARSGCWRTVRRLIRRGCSMDRRDNRGWTALHEAAAGGSAECVREIMRAVWKKGSPSDCREYVSILTHEGESACFLAAQRGHLSVLRLLLKGNPPEFDINQLTNDLSCPLYAAVDNGHKDVVELLVRKGAELNRTHTHSCWTCLHQAVYKGHSGIVRLLSTVCDLEAVDEHNITPLFLAAQHGQRECLEILINAGADVNAAAADLANPLFIASQGGHESCVELLLDHDADPDEPCSNEWNQLPIHASAEFGHIGILRRLIAVTSRIIDRMKILRSPLYSAVQSRQTECVKILLEEGYHPNAQYYPGEPGGGLGSPLTWALCLEPYQPDSESVKLLLAAGGNLCEGDMFYALCTDKMDLLELILQHKWIPRLQVLLGFVPPYKGKTAFTQWELSELLWVALNQLETAPWWLPLLLKAGLDPHLLLRREYLVLNAESEVLNYLLEFVNWSTIDRDLKCILDERQSEKTWEPPPFFGSVPSLFHLCRLELREILGTDRLIRDEVIQQLPVPAVLHKFLQFRDIPDLSLPHSPLRFCPPCRDCLSFFYLKRKILDIPYVAL
ncbi:ankyrin repeat and SOCS box protein 3 isoform X2 [Gouania willdenowi]|uniref:Ankyrin repeat and SOCS box protein 3-like n=1 Tax=Gouania willdenowi TaxID=441366 RepID=A0A8C5N6U7_GOUWI|nr:ankyrin repeat and SOCS box protein 3-like isoform X2 [Gouania willdenowi]